jgi:hypothetical protein
MTVSRFELSNLRFGLSNICRLPLKAFCNLLAFHSARPHSASGLLSFGDLPSFAGADVAFVGYQAWPLPCIKRIGKKMLRKMLWLNAWAEREMLGSEISGHTGTDTKTHPRQLSC